MTLQRIAKGKYLHRENGRISEIIHFPRGSWIVTDVTRPDARTVTGEFRTLSEFKKSRTHEL